MSHFSEFAEFREAASNGKLAQRSLAARPEGSAAAVLPCCRHAPAAINAYNALTVFMNTIFMCYTISMQVDRGSNSQIRTSI